MAGGIELLLRDLAPQVLNAIIRMHSDFDLCEDAVQEALLAASVQWQADGVPSNPKGWLIKAASRRRIDLWRNEQSRRQREDSAAALAVPNREPISGIDDTLTLLQLCCHPALTPTSQLALTLRAVGGLTTAEIASALLVPEATVSQRILRAKKRIKATGAEFRMPNPEDRPARMDAVRHVLYLIFNEGYTASSGSRLHRVELTTEAIRLARQLHDLLPADGEVTGLLALMLLTDARTPARARADGSIIPLVEQDRALWDRTAIGEGVALITESLATRELGPYQLQAAIAAVHDEAPAAADTDWPQILGLYELLRLIAPGPMVELNWIVAIAEVHGPAVGLRCMDQLATSPGLAGHYRFDAVRAHLLDMAGEHDTARDCYLAAARRTLSAPERQYLLSRVAPPDERPGR
jgi:RNA polymerase sigma factor (sigma-70 family)